MWAGRTRGAGRNEAFHSPTGAGLTTVTTRDHPNVRRSGHSELLELLARLREAVVVTLEEGVELTALGLALRAQAEDVVGAVARLGLLAVDHRIGESVNLGVLLSGEMGPLVDALRREEIARRLAAL